MKARKWILYFFLAAVAAFLALFSARVYSYYRQIQRGEMVDIGKYRTEFTRRASATSSATSEIDLARLRSADDPFLGGKDAAVEIVEFADFECPFSRKAFPAFRELAAEYGDRVKFTYRHFPIDEVHPRARAAATAAFCAREQGKFWAYHDKLFQNQDRLSDADLRAFAASTGLDISKFNSCLVSARASQSVKKDSDDGAALGVHGTPTWFIVVDGAAQKIEGVIPIEAWKELLRRLAP